MNIPKYSLDNKKVVYFFLVILLLGGIISFFKLAKKEDSPFIIKTAVLITRYPGATPAEVEKLITEPIEREIQSMSQVSQIKSESRFGISKINIELDPSIAPDKMPEKWDELRRKVANIQPKLPSGASQIIINDDFGDVFGIYYALTAEKGFSFKELRDWAQRIKIELTPIGGVQKVALFGEQTEVINIFISVPKLANLGIDPTAITQILQTQNLLVNTGEIGAGKYQIKIVADGTYKSIDDIKNQIILSSKGNEIRIADIADVKRGYMNPPSTMMRVNGKKAIGIGVASGATDDVVAVGDEVEKRLESIKGQIPLGIEIVTLYPENQIAREANNGFIINLIESLLIVIIIIFLIMGYRSGLLIGSSLLFSVGGTLLIMLIADVGLNRTSLAAFIIAMGMLVDNAIVVTDNARVNILRGMGRRDALIEGATTPQWGLLGATLIAVCSFLPLYLAPASVAEIVKPLFIVLAVSLSLSWLLALMQTTTFGDFILKESSGKESKDPYDNRFFHKFESIIAKLIKRRYITLTSVVALLFVSLWVMSIMPQTFFPSMDKPFMRADLVFPEGFSIKEVESKIIEIEQHFKDDKRVKNISVSLGSSPIRYYLASASFGPMPNYANVLIETYSSDEAPKVEEEFYDYLNGNFPDIITKSSLFMLSPQPEARIEIGFIGENIDTLEKLTNRAAIIARKFTEVTDIRNNWGNKAPVIKPNFSTDKGLRLGITRQQLALAIRAATNGIPLGEYREGDQFMPILLKDSQIDSIGANDIRTLPVFSSKGKSVKIEQVSEGFDLAYEYNMIKRYNRERLMMMICEPVRGQNEIEAFNKIYTAVKNQISIPEGYKLIYFGNQEQQDKSNSALGANVPLTFLIIFITLLLLFPKHYRSPIVIMAMLPLIFIGVVWGLILLGKSFDFFAILGLLGLIGMNIKNAIVLIDQIGIEQKNGLSPLDAVISATKSRIIPVAMASGTTILGMLPLLGDAMFGGMAATIMGGLFMATILTIFVLPVTYCIFFKIKSY